MNIEKKDDDDDKIEPLCECNLCYIFRIVLRFVTQLLKFVNM